MAGIVALAPPSSKHGSWLAQDTTAIESLDAGLPLRATPERAGWI